MSLTMKEYPTLPNGLMKKGWSENEEAQYYTKEREKNVRVENWLSGHRSS